MHPSMREAIHAAGPPYHYYNDKPSSGYTPTSFDTNIVIITAALLFVLICALGLNAAIKCALNFTRRQAPLEAPQAAAALRSLRANTGIKKKELKLLPTTIYTKQNTLKHSNSILEENKNGSTHLNIMQADADDEHHYMQDSQCIICLSDFQDGEKIRVLPKCKHGFHIECVDAWLCNHSSCPTCRGDLTNTLLPVHPHNNNKRPNPQVQLHLVISPSGTLTPALYRVLPSQQYS